jgi:hypothetical protein
VRDNEGQIEELTFPIVDSPVDKVPYRSASSSFPSSSYRLVLILVMRRRRRLHGLLSSSSVSVAFSEEVKGGHEVCSKDGKEDEDDGSCEEDKSEFRSRKGSGGFVFVEVWRRFARRVCVSGWVLGGRILGELRVRCRSRHAVLMKVRGYASIAFRPFDFLLGSASTIISPPASKTNGSSSTSTGTLGRHPSPEHVRPSHALLDRSRKGERRERNRPAPHSPACVRCGRSSDQAFLSLWHSMMGTMACISRTATRSMRAVLISLPTPVRVAFLPFPLESFLVSRSYCDGAPGSESKLANAYADGKSSGEAVMPTEVGRNGRERG